MILRISFLLFFLLIAPAAFIYVRHLRRAAPLIKILFLFPNVVLTILTVYFMCTDGNMARIADAVGFYLIVLLFITLPELVYSIFLALSLLPLRKKVCNVLRTIGLVLAFFIAAAVATGYIACFSVLRVENHDYVSPCVPKAFEGYKIVQFSDLHIGTYRYFPHTVEKIIQTINDQHADVICFTGDLVNFSQDEIPQFLEQMKKLRATDGVYSVLGNHDYLGYVRMADAKARKRGIIELVCLQRKAGWDVLLNEKRVIRRGSDSIYIVGSENDGKPPFPEKGDLQKALKCIPHNSFKLLLSHDPTQWRRKVLPKTNIQLTLSGHTHAAQIKVLHKSPAALVYNEYDGMYDDYELQSASNERMRRTLFVSSGIGEALLPFRLGAWPKIDVITLHSAR